MSGKSTPVTDQHFSYLAQRTRPEDRFLRDLKTAAAAAGLPAIWISPEQGSLMQILLRLTGAREVLEVGTLGGYSSIWMARALPAGGRLRTIEVADAHADFAQEWIGRSDVADVVEVLRGDARAVLPGLADASVDACFIDADKESYPTYLRECLRLLRPGGLLMADNAFAFGKLFAPASEANVGAIRQFNEMMAAETALQSVIVPLGDGCWVGVKLVDPGAGA